MLFGKGIGIANFKKVCHAPQLDTRCSLGEDIAGRDLSVHTVSSDRRTFEESRECRLPITRHPARTEQYGWDIATR